MDVNPNPARAGFLFTLLYCSFACILKSTLLGFYLGSVFAFEFIDCLGTDAMEHALQMLAHLLTPRGKEVVKWSCYLRPIRLLIISCLVFLKSALNEWSEMIWLHISFWNAFTLQSNDPWPLHTCMIILILPIPFQASFSYLYAILHDGNYTVEVVLKSCFLAWSQVQPKRVDAGSSWSSYISDDRLRTWHAA